MISSRAPPLISLAGLPLPRLKFLLHLEEDFYRSWLSTPGSSIWIRNLSLGFDWMLAWGCPKSVAHTSVLKIFEWTLDCIFNLRVDWFQELRISRFPTRFCLYLLQWRKNSHSSFSMDLFRCTRVEKINILLKWLDVLPLLFASSTDLLKSHL